MNQNKWIFCDRCGHQNIDHKDDGCHNQGFSRGCICSQLVPKEIDGIKQLLEYSYKADRDYEKLEDLHKHEGVVLFTTESSNPLTIAYEKKHYLDEFHKSVVQCQTREMFLKTR